MKKEKKPETARTRRTFIQWLWLIVGGVAAFEFLLLVFSFLKPDKPKEFRDNGDNIIDAGPIEAFKPGTVTAFVRGRFYLVCHERGGFLALSSKCTHLGCSLPWNQEAKQFICPCHSSKFDITGDVLSAPAPRAMDHFKLEIVNGNTNVDLGRPIQRKGFDKDQLVFPDTIISKAKKD